MRNRWFFFLVFLLLLAACNVPGETVAEPPLPGAFTVEDKGCAGKGAVSFTFPPRRLEDIEFIVPLGQVVASGGHVTPVDHGYYYPPGLLPGWNPDDPKYFSDVFAPADGIITELSLVGGRANDYRIIIHHTCTFYTIYIHIKELAPGISEGAKITVGQVIGRASSFDFSVHDDEVTLSGFIVPEHYQSSPWIIHSVDMFAYFTEPIRTQLLAKNPRQAEPRSGKIDYDIDGRLIGNWFKEGTNWYWGIAQGDLEQRYWSGHLSLAPDVWDPSFFVIGLGDFGGVSAQFGIKGNPDPALVSKESGLVIYELVGYTYRIKGTNELWDYLSFVAGLEAVGFENEVKGVILFQLVEDRRLKVEVFPGKTAAEVSGFTSEEIFYER